MVELSNRLKKDLLKVLEEENLDSFPFELKPYLLYDAILFAFSEPDPFYKEEIEKTILISSHLYELLEKITEVFFDDLVYIPDHKYLLKSKNFEYIPFGEFRSKIKKIIKDSFDKKSMDIKLKKLFTYSPKVYLLLYIYEQLYPGIIPSILRTKKEKQRIINDLIKSLEKFNSFEEVSLYLRKEKSKRSRTI